LEHLLAVPSSQLALQLTTATTSCFESPLSATTTPTAPVSPQVNNSPIEKTNASKHKVSLSDYLKRRKTTDNSRVLTRENSVDSISSLHAADSTVSPEKEKLPETALVLSAEPTAAAALGVQVESRDLFKPAAALESIESGKSKVNKVLTELMASNDKLAAQKKSIDLLETRLGFFNNAKIAPVLRQQQAESPDLNLMTDYSAVSSPEMNVMSSSRMSIEEPSSCQLDTTTATSKTLFEHISSKSCSPIKKPEIDNSAASQEQAQPPVIVITKDQAKNVSRSSSASSLSSTDSSKKNSNTTSVSVATPPETTVSASTNCSSLRSSRDSRVSRSSSPLSIGVREENARKERSDKKTEKEQRNSKTNRSAEPSSKLAAAKSSKSSDNNLSSSSQSSLSSSHSLEQQARRPARHEGRTRERSSDGYGRHRQDEGRGRYEYGSGEGTGESRSEYKRKKANDSDDEGGSSKSRRVSGQKQYAEGFVSQRLEYSSSGSRFGGQVSRNKVEYGGGRGESSEHRDRYSRSSSQMQQGFGEFRRNRSKEREGEAFLFVGTFLLP